MHKLRSPGLNQTHLVSPKVPSQTRVVMERKQHCGSCWHSCSRNVRGKQTQPFPTAFESKHNNESIPSRALQSVRLRQGPPTGHQREALSQWTVRAHATIAPSEGWPLQGPALTCISEHPFWSQHTLYSQDGKGMKQPLMTWMFLLPLIPEKIG